MSDLSREEREREWGPIPVSVTMTFDEWARVCAALSTLQEYAPILKDEIDFERTMQTIRAASAATIVGRKYDN